MTFQGNNWKFFIIIIEIEKAPLRSSSTNFGEYYTIFLGSPIKQFDIAKSDLEIVINSLESK